VITRAGVLTAQARAAERYGRAVSQCCRSVLQSAPVKASGDDQKDVERRISGVGDDHGGGKSAPQIVEAAWLMRSPGTRVGMPGG
jgi:hypothetical protein